VNISVATYELIKDAERPPAGRAGSRGAPLFNFTHRGKIQAKGKGEVDMWFVQMT
jgi:hypothetical protein